MKKNYINDNGICYDCADEKDNRNLYFNKDCIESCAEIYGEYDADKTCITCSEKDPKKNLYFSIKEKKCIDEEECIGEIDNFLNICDECENHNLLYVPKNSSCVSECDFLYVNQSHICKLCTNDINNPEIKHYYQNGKCVEKCNNTIGFGFMIQNFDGEEIQYCLECYKQDNLKFLDEESVPKIVDIKNLL